MNILHRYTLKTLRQNRVRTLVTIIGIVLSVAMLTAVTTSITSLQNYLLKIIIQTDGGWHGRIMALDKAGQDSLTAEAGVTKTAFLHSFGYAELENVKTGEKPYLFIGGMNEAFSELLPMYLLEGRMPQTEGEILVPSHLTVLHPEFSTGSTFSLLVGERVYQGKTLGQHEPLVSEVDGGETMENRQLMIFTVVGTYHKPSFERNSAPGYTVLTIAGDSDRTADAYFTMAKPGDVYGLLKQSPYASFTSAVNSDYMLVSGAEQNAGYKSVLYGMGSILILIIVFGSVSLIYNSFSISLSERTRQFGLLSSVGATKRQMRRSVFFEALFLSGIGIPLGIGSGLLGIGLTLRFLEKPFLGFINHHDLAAPVKLTLWTSWEALLIAAGLGLLTVLLSAAIPARRALKVQTIEAIRQTRDIKLSARRVKTSRLTMSLFGIEGVLASKNFKRSRKQYRATVISLFVSIVLFISASSFSSYTMASAGDVMDKADFDLSYNVESGQAKKKEDMDRLFAAMAGVNGVTQSAYAYEYMGQIAIPKEAVNPKADMQNLFSEENGKFSIFGYLVFIDDASFAEYLQQTKKGPAVYLNPEAPVALLLDFMRFRAADGRFRTFHVLQSGGLTAEVKGRQDPEGYTLEDVRTEENGDVFYIYASLADGSELTLSEEEIWHTFPVQLGEIVQQPPFSVEPNYYGLTLLYPYSAAEKVVGQLDFTSGAMRMYFKADNHKTVYNEMLTLLAGSGYKTGYLYNYAGSVESVRSVVLVLNVFSYGFIALISLISMANVFNTISTNIGLRRREFAMLKSIGVTQRGFRRMMNFECILYGFKGLVYGIPAALGLTYLMFQSMSGGWEVSYYVPWKSILISVGSVFAVVFATMLYAMGKIRKDNPIDALKNENL